MTNPIHEHLPIPIEHYQEQVRDRLVPDLTLRPPPEAGRFQATLTSGYASLLPPLVPVIPVEVDPIDPVVTRDRQK